VWFLGYCLRVPSFSYKMKALTMSELKKRGDVPLSPKDRHQRDTGTGSYNRFSLLQPNSPRPRLGSKRKLDPDPTSIESKSLSLRTIYSDFTYYINRYYQLHIRHSSAHSLVTFIHIIYVNRYS
jgi:hypothetical protein